MKQRQLFMNFARTISLLLVVLAVYWSFKSLKPTYRDDSNAPSSEFSAARALKHVKSLSQQPHWVGSPGHADAKGYIITALKKLGLETNTQEGYTSYEGDFTKATNVLARIKGTGSGKALMLLCHYDSHPHSSYGASDAASGVATILEGVRAFLAENNTPKNDIIILLSDAEEVGLNGANLFVTRHAWAKDVGLVLNFEARGSGGPSYMLIETNQGNAKLIEAFSEANVQYPVANSLAYSIYKMLPNDTDLTIFREKGDINGFNFAFIDDHYDYHTALDNYDRLDRASLAHQGSYLMPLLKHFGNSDLHSLNSIKDYVYFNIPLFKLVSYPFEWIWPMFGIALLAFVLLIFNGLNKKALHIKPLFTGFVPMLGVLIINGLLGHFAWKVLKWWYPGFKDILQGFPYNGHLYIVSFAFFSLGMCFWVYKRFRKIDTPNILVAPIFIWLVICGLIANYLKGASFFIVPLFGLLAAFFVVINQKKPSPYLLFFLALPAILIHAPFIKMFPVGLGLKMMVTATLFTSLLYFLLLPLFDQSKGKSRFPIICFILFAFFGVAAHLKSEFSEERPKPSSLLYVYSADEDSAKWATYDNVLIGWNSQFLDKENDLSEKTSYKTIDSKYSSKFTYTAEAPKKNIPLPDISKTIDTVIGKKRFVELCVTHNRIVSRLEVFTNETPLHNATINSIELSRNYLENRNKNGRLVTHYINNNAYTEIALEITKDANLELTLYEISNDLLSNNLFSIPERPKNTIPMPFVLNDAILVIKKIKFD